MFDFDFEVDYTMVIYAVLAFLVIGGGYYYYSRSRKPAEKHVEFDMSQDESVSSKDEYICEGDVCMKK